MHIIVRSVCHVMLANQSVEVLGLKDEKFAVRKENLKATYLLCFQFSTSFSLSHTHTENGFTGRYMDSTEDLIEMLLSQSDEAVSEELFDLLSFQPLTRRRRQTIEAPASNESMVLIQNGTETSTLPEDEVVGIEDPMTCLELGEAILFQVSNVSYPVYDADNLWNTFPEFDYGLFRQLNETQQLTGEGTLFPFRFYNSGVFTFYLSNNPDRKIYFRVVEETAQCPEIGPFFPATPSRAAQLGIVRSDDILRAPNWLLIGSMLAAAVTLMAILLVALVSEGGRE